MALAALERMRLDTYNTPRTMKHLRKHQMMNQQDVMTDTLVCVQITRQSDMIHLPAWPMGDIFQTTPTSPGARVRHSTNCDIQHGSRDSTWNHRIPRCDRGVLKKGKFTPRRVACACNEYLYSRACGLC